MTVALLSGINCHRYGPLTNELHNWLRMGRIEYPKTLSNEYDLAIDWKVDTGSVAVPLNYGVDFVTDDRGKYGDVHDTDGSVIITRSWSPV